jgi:kinesin family protein 2/24
MEETQAINLSLLALKDCIRARTLRSPHIPYRRSKLTLLLKNLMKQSTKDHIGPTKAKWDRTNGAA